MKKLHTRHSRFVICVDLFIHSLFIYYQQINILLFAPCFLFILSTSRTIMMIMIWIISKTRTTFIMKYNKVSWHLSSFGVEHYAYQKIYFRFLKVDDSFYIQNEKSKHNLK